MNISVFPALSIVRLIIFVLIHTLLVQLLLLKTLVCIFAETSNGFITYNIFIPLLAFVLTKLCVPSLPKMSGSCSKPLSPMSDLNFNTIRQLGTSISKRSFIRSYQKKYSVMCLFVAICRSLLKLIVSISLVLNLWNIVD